MGYYLGIAKNTQNSIKNNKKRKAIILSIIIPILLHFTYDLFLINLNKISYICFTIFVLIIYMLAYFKIKKLNSTKKLIRKKEN